MRVTRISISDRGSIPDFHRRYNFPQVWGHFQIYTRATRLFQFNFWFPQKLQFSTSVRTIPDSYKKRRDYCSQFLISAEAISFCNREDNSWFPQRRQFLHSSIVRTIPESYKRRRDYCSQFLTSAEVIHFHKCVRTISDFRRDDNFYILQLWGQF